MKKKQQTVKQTGVALITVLIIVALIGGSVALILKRQNAMISNIVLVNLQSKAVQYLFSLEEVAKIFLEEDKDRTVDYYEEENEDGFKWHEPQEYNLENAKVEFQIWDLQAGININNIFNIEKQSITIKERAKPDFAGCFDNLNLALGNDAETRSVINYLSSKRLKVIDHPSELQNIAYIENDDYQKFRPYIYAIENQENKTIPINVNTAGREVLKCLDRKLDGNPEVINRIIDRQENNHFSSIGDFKNLMEKEGFDDPKDFYKLISVKSYYFMLKSTITIGELELQAESIFNRNGSKIQLIYRSYYLNNFANANR